MAGIRQRVEKACGTTIAQKKKKRDKPPNIENLHTLGAQVDRSLVIVKGRAYRVIAKRCWERKTNQGRPFQKFFKTKSAGRHDRVGRQHIVNCV